MNETPANELTDFVSNPVYTDAQTTSANAYHIPSLQAKKIPYNATTPQPSSLQAKAKKLMQKAKKNMRKIKLKKAVVQKFREYDQKLEALINFNVSEAFEKVFQARVLTEIKKLLPTHILKAHANNVKPRLNTFSNETHTTHQQLFDTLYDSITLDHDALNALDAEPSFYKQAHNNQDPPNNHNTPVIQPLDQEDEYVWNHPNPKWFLKKQGSANGKRRTTWFDLLLKSDIDQNDNHILGPSTVTITKKIKAVIQKDELTITDLEGAGLERLKQQYQNNVELEYHVDQLKAAVLSEAK
ncbi:hypothetical protein Tco_1310944 [Tanacetum coccineum]